MRVDSDFRPESMEGTSIPKGFFCLIPFAGVDGLPGAARYGRQVAPDALHVRIPLIV